MTARAHPSPAQNPPESTEDSPQITVQQLAERVGYSRDWMLRMARKGLIPHVRVGRPPLPGRKDTRPVRFTAAQADEVEAMVRHVEYRPAGGAA